MPTSEPFKVCPFCGTSWPDYREFITDRALRVAGFQPSLVAPKYHLILVTHRTAYCGTTLAVWADRLRVLLYDDWRECMGEHDTSWVHHVLKWLRRHELPPHLVEPAPDARPAAPPRAIAV
jgi:hypothetical protein